MKLKYLIPAVCLSGAAVFTGCLNDNADIAGSDGKSQVAVAASLAPPNTWTRVLYNMGTIPAMTSNSNIDTYNGWVVDKNPDLGPVNNFAIRRFSNASQVIMPGYVTDLDIRANYQLWAIASDNRVYINSIPSNTPTHWDLAITPTPVRQIAAGANHVWMVSTVPNGLGYQLYKYKGSGLTADRWFLVPGQVTKVDVDNNNDLWAVNSQGNVFLLPGGVPTATWQQKYWLQDAADIACGGGKIYIRTTTAISGGYTVKKWNGSDFIDMPGGIVDLQVDMGGRLWAGDSNNNLYYYTP